MSVDAALATTADRQTEAATLVYRIVVEALTNVRRHAPGATRVAVRIHGAEVRGGTFTAGPSEAGRGWQVAAELPWEPPDTVEANVLSIRVLIADDQEDLRSGYRMVIDAQPDMHVVGEAADGRSAVDLDRHASTASRSLVSWPVPAPPRPATEHLEVRLTDREHLVATLVAKGLGNDGIAAWVWSTNPPQP